MSTSRPNSPVLCCAHSEEAFHKTMEWLCEQERQRHELEQDLLRLRELYPETVETDIDYVDLAVAEALGFVGP